MYRPVEFEVNIDTQTEYVKGDAVVLTSTRPISSAARCFLIIPVEWNLSRSLYFTPEDPQFAGYAFNVYDRRWRPCGSENRKTR